MKYFYFDQVTTDDYTMNPTRFNNKNDGFATLQCVESIATFFPEGNDNPPISFFRHMNTDRTRFAGMVRCGIGPLSVHTNAHTDDLANRETPIEKYAKLSDSPLVYGYHAKAEPYCERRYFKDFMIWKEGKNGEILDVTLEPFPVAFFLHRCEQFPVSTFYTHPYLMRGTYEGKTIVGIGNDDRQYIPEGPKDEASREQNYQKTTNYLTANCAGIREDGRREMAFFNGNPGHMAGGYWLEGEEPILDDNVELIGEWVHLPYVNDGTCVMTDFIFKIGSKTIHFQGKWGLKGWTKQPNLDKHGQSQVMGIFYEGEKPYKHILWQTFIENMEAFDYKLKEVGYKVLD